MQLTLSLTCPHFGPAACEPFHSFSGFVDKVSKFIFFGLWPSAACHDQRVHSAHVAEELLDPIDSALARISPQQVRTSGLRLVIRLDDSTVRGLQRLAEKGLPGVAAEEATPASLSWSHFDRSQAGARSIQSWLLDLAKMYEDKAIPLLENGFLKARQVEHSRSVACCASFPFSACFCSGHGNAS